MKDSGFGSFLAGVIIGGLIGTAIGLLLAPESGEDLREHVSDFVDEKKSAMGEAVSEGKAAAEQARAAMMSAMQKDALTEAAEAVEGSAS
jgi:gas vesicle protein